MEIRRIVTGVLPDGSSGIVEDALAKPVSPAALAGLDFFPLWATENGHSLIAPEGSALPYWPGPSGTRFLLVRWAPATEVTNPEGDPDRLAADAERQLPGLMAAFEADNPGMHTSATVDYGICLQGEMWLELDPGQQAQITPGTCVVQRGTRHIWSNRSAAPALMLFVLVGAVGPDDGADA